jgi:hypothetical protein
MAAAFVLVRDHRHAALWFMKTYTSVNGLHPMRKLFLLGLVLTIVLPACALEQMTVARLEKKIAAYTADRAGASLPVQRMQDDGLVFELNRISLSERLGSVKQEQIAKKYSLGQLATSALQMLAARSALLDPPDAELPNKPPPDAETQQRLIAQARTFVFQTLKRLPNFFATRTTTSASGTTPDLNKNGMALRMGLFPAGGSSSEITFRDGEEILQPMKTEGPATLPEMGLESWGEFGPEPAIVLLDASKGTMSFQHWEQTSAGLAAVFHYYVPRTESHYEVNYSCLGTTAFHDVPGYHGSLAIDPASGAILRTTVEADWTEGDPITHVASVIEYGPVEIGERNYVCPLHSLTFMVEETSATCSHNGHSLRSLTQLAQPVLMLNQTNFTNYHRLGSTSTILYKTDELPPPAQNPAPPQPPTQPPTQPPR